MMSFESTACLSHAWTPRFYVLCLARPVVSVLIESSKQVLQGVDVHRQDLLKDVYALNRKIGKISSNPA